MISQYKGLGGGFIQREHVNLSVHGDIGAGELLVVHLHQDKCPLLASRRTAFVDLISLVSASGVICSFLVNSVSLCGSKERGKYWQYPNRSRS